MSASRVGRILTFYSFKGGVGRTMSLANTAFIAAMNGQRVLVMDWDLEAPGLGYYFRGLLDEASTQALKRQRGILDIASRWVATARSGDAAAMQLQFDAKDDGTLFSECASTLAPMEFLPAGARLDYIGTGQIHDGTESGSSYEAQLAEFSWQEFFTDYAGGAIIQSLTEWARAHYDLILVDSRTGLADVAGICTMQIPDEVVLCFVLNRQNIDGVSRVARAIRNNRNDSVRLRAIPMRTAQEGSADESEARARAISELTKIGGFTHERLTEDFKLAVRASDAVPFQETLLALLPRTADVEVLCAHYRQFASALVGTTFAEPTLDPDWARAIQLRLQPRRTTLAYLRELEAKGSDRLRGELSNLLDAALEAHRHGQPMAVDYVEALVGVALQPAIIGYSLIEEMSSNNAEKGLDLIRVLHRADPERWGTRLTDAIVRYWVNYTFQMDIEQQRTLLDEANSVFSEDQSLTNRLRHVDFLQMAAGKLQSEGNLAEAEQVLSAAWDLHNTLINEPASEKSQRQALEVGEIILCDVQGRIYQSRKQWNKALKFYRRALMAIAQTSVPLSFDPLPYLNFSLHARSATLLLEMGAKEDAARHALEASRLGADSGTLSGTMFATLAKPVIANEDAEIVLQFGETYLLSDRSTPITSIAPAIKRVPLRTARAIDALDQMTRLLLTLDRRRTQALLDAFAALLQHIRPNDRRAQRRLQKGATLVPTLHSLESLTRHAPRDSQLHEAASTWLQLINSSHRTAHEGSDEHGDP